MVAGNEDPERLTAWAKEAVKNDVFMNEVVRRVIEDKGNEILARAVGEVINHAMMKLRVERRMVEVETPAKYDPKIEGKGKYEVIDPRFLYLGKSYSEWVSDWFNWFISADADKRTSGPVVFLRSLGLPNKTTGAFLSEVTNLSQQLGAADSGSLNNVSLDPNSYPKPYLNDPNIRIGGEGLKIFKEQAVLVPIIIAYELANTPYKDWGRLIEYTGPTIDYGDNPPSEDQLTINGEPIDLPPGLKMEDFRIITPIFTAVIPETDYGRSIKDVLEIPLSPGSYPAMVEGYFVMIKFSTGTYWVHSWASGPRELNGVYFSELLYQVQVGGRRKRMPGVTQIRPSRNVSLLKRTLAKKEKLGELKADQIKRLETYFTSPKRGII
jgi:hypothetical protein